MSNPKCPKFFSIDMTMNLCYVFFDNDEDAIKALNFLREDVKTFR